MDEMDESINGTGAHLWTGDSDVQARGGWLEARGEGEHGKEVRGGLRGVGN